MKIGKHEVGIEKHYPDEKSKVTGNNKPSLYMKLLFTL